jgi:3-dehydroquinate dehydratase II
MRFATAAVICRGSALVDRPVIFILNGPNLNLLGTREPDIYGSDTLDDIAGRLDDQARKVGADIDFRQSNHEGHLIDWLHEAQAVGAKAVLLNAAGFTHTSIAILDAIKAIKVPVFEVHLSDPHKREEFRHVSYVSMAAKAVFAGHGAKSYELALDAALQL